MTDTYEHLTCGCEVTLPQGFTHTEGHDWAGKAARHPCFDLVSQHGLDGWDAGQWPLVVIATSDNRPEDPARPFGITTRAEGDLLEQRYRHRECRESALDQIVAFYWVAMGDDHEAATAARTARAWDPFKPEDGMGTEPLPERFRGRFSWARLNEHQAQEHGLAVTLITTDGVQPAVLGTDDSIRPTGPAQEVPQ